MNTDDEDEDWYDDEDADQDSEEVDCPEFGKAMHADAEQCPHCGHWLTEEDHRERGTDTGPSKRIRMIAAFLLAVFVLGLLAEIVLFF